MLPCVSGILLCVYGIRDFVLCFLKFALRLQDSAFQILHYALRLILKPAFQIFKHLGGMGIGLDLGIDLLHDAVLIYYYR